METDKIKTLEEFKDFASYHFKLLKPIQDKEGESIREIRFYGYTDMTCLGVNLIRMCLHIIYSDELDNREIYIGSVLELALQLIPRAEIEVLDEIYKMVNENRETEQSSQ
ncbi:hypothetical protein BC749_12113 [Flavobacterium araucananum]|uniref:Uncharacterized protein n=1 Tax=Flavobacterium araucananum TaxID=946678 RepID=A0A227P7F2_9FLAO|nr:hypothetical protein [Flavobacterium araucananum]OXG05867.1 hypothetical protein B0A64_12030 [Flavobacterium araucananum]PWJ90103.1 hypothetical protein BC749_12113 [Flavobacterium araucananum]